MVLKARCLNNNEELPVAIIMEGAPHLMAHVLFPRDETHHPPLLTRLGSTGLVKKANVVGENELVNEYLLCKLCREYIIFHDKTQ